MFCRFQDEDEQPTTTTTQAPRRRIPEPTQQQKTVVNHKQSYESISRKNTDTRRPQVTLTEDEDDDNVIALPTESITENIPFPENILTTRVTTTPSPIQVTENSLVQSESLNDVLDSENEFEATTLTNDFSDNYNVDKNGISKQNDEILSFLDISRTESPRPFSRPFVTRTRAPAIRNEVVTTRESSTVSSRRRPSKLTTIRSSIAYETDTDDDVTSTSRRSGQTFAPGYRGTARYRTKQTKNGVYDHDANRYQPVEDNRVRAINFDRSNANRVSSIDRTTTTTQSSSTSSRRRPSITRTETTPRTIKTTTASVDDDEMTTEQRVIEQQSRFALKPNERPEKISFTLGTGSRIEFNTPKLDQRNDTSKSKIITGPLASSPLTSTRDFKKGHAEEIPLIKSNITVESHSDKLDLSEIPLNKSDIASFVSADELTTTPRVRLRPSKGGFAQSYSSKSIDDSSAATTTENPEEEDDTTSRLRLRPSESSTTQTSIESDNLSTATQRTRFPPRTRVTIEQTKNEIDESSSTVRRTRPITPSRFTRPSSSVEQSEVTASRSRDFSRFLNTRNRVNTNSLDDSAFEESTTRKARVKITKINRAPEQKVIAADINNLAADDNLKKSRIRPISSGKLATRIPFEEPNDNDENTENPLDESDETTQSSFNDIDDLTTLDTPVDTTLSSPRQVSSKKVDAFATRQTIAESTADENEKSPKTTRRLIVTRRRPVTSENRAVEEDQQSETPKTRTTRRRIISRTRIRPQVTDTDNANSELSENTETTNVDASTVGRSRNAAGRRTRVYKRPASSTARPETDDENDEEKPKLIPLRRIVKVNKKPVESTFTSRKFTKVTKKFKSAKALAEQELGDDDFILKPEDLEQDIINYNNEEKEEKDVEDTIEVAIDEESSSDSPARPANRLSSRPNSASRVTIKRRPAIINIRQQTTLHPASTRTIKDSQSTRAKTVTIRRKYGTTTGSRTDPVEVDDGQRKFTVSEKNRKYYKNRGPSSSSTSSAPNITPYNTDTTEYDEVDDTTDISIDNDNNTLQSSSSVRPRISVRVRNTKPTTMTPPTTLHHVFAILDETKGSASNDSDNNASEVIKKLQKLIEINRVVEVYSKEDKIKVLKNNKFKTVKSSNWILEKPRSLDKFGEISRQTIIKVSKSAAAADVNGNSTAANVTSHPEISSISLEGLNREQESPVFLLRPASNEAKPIVISLKSLDKVILKKSNNDDEVSTTTESYEDTTNFDEK